jgi:hypothetical protein
MFGHLLAEHHARRDARSAWLVGNIKGKALEK